MVYITVRQSPVYHQMTLEEYLLKKSVQNNWSGRIIRRPA